MYSWSIALSALLCMQAAAKTAVSGQYSFTFYKDTNCEGEVNGDPLVGDIGDSYCMDFATGVMSAMATFTDLKDKNGDEIDGRWCPSLSFPMILGIYLYRELFFHFF